MKTSEFIKRVEELGYKVVDCDDHISVCVGHDVVSSVNKKSVNRVDTNWNEYVPNELFDLCTEYAKTPIEEREEPKKYYLRLPDYLYESSSYLNYNAIDKTYCFLGGFGFGELQTQFTQEEIDNLPSQDFIKTLVKEEVKE